MLKQPSTVTASTVTTPAGVRGGGAHHIHPPHALSHALPRAAAHGAGLWGKTIHAQLTGHPSIQAHGMLRPNSTTTASRHSSSVVAVDLWWLLHCPWNHLTSGSYPRLSFSAGAWKLLKQTRDV